MGVRKRTEIEVKRKDRKLITEVKNNKMAKEK
jgi:hypothetical protein